MQQIGDWLEKLGMSEYVDRFVDNKIDFSLLPHITDQDLKDIGIPLGHRRKILAAIDQGTASIQPVAEATRDVEQKTHDAPERRFVTVLFSDLVGSTALSERMDAEDLREVISTYQECVSEIVRRFDGFVAKYMGDAVLVYFGYPEAHEDDPERAVRAGLELVAAVSNLKTHTALQTRVGIATGLVVIGDLIGSGSAQEQALVGKTPNLAARLQGVAEPNMVVIAESTRKLVGNLFELKELGAKDLKGIGGPARAWAALRPSSAESRFEALHASGLTDLVGRQEELDLLMRRWSKTTTAEGQVVLLCGEAGIGKSRLTSALSERLATEPHTRLRYFCSPQHTDSALYPIIGQMERVAGFTHDDTAQTKLDKLDAVLSKSFTPSEDKALFAELLSLPNDGRYRTSDPERAHFALYTGEALGRGVENWFSHYEAFAVLIGLRLMRHGFPQGGVVTMLRRMKPELEKQHALILKQDRAAAFDDQQILVRAKPGDLVVGTTHPVFLVLSSPDGEIRSIAGPAAICQGQKELMLFIKAQGVGQTWTVFELVNSIHALSSAPAKTKPLKRGRGN